MDSRNDSLQILYKEVVEAGLSDVRLLRQTQGTAYMQCDLLNCKNALKSGTKRAPPPAPAAVATAPTCSGLLLLQIQCNTNEQASSTEDLLRFRCSWDPTNMITNAAGRLVLREEKKDGVSVTLIRVLPELS